MRDIDIYLAGEIHNNFDQSHATKIIVKDMAKQNKIDCIALELPVEKYQKILDDYDTKKNAFSLGGLSPYGLFAQKFNLDLIATDYKNTFLTNLTDQLNEIHTQNQPPKKILKLSNGVEINTSTKDEETETEFNKEKIQEMYNLGEKILKPFTLDGKLSDNPVCKDFLRGNHETNIVEFLLNAVIEERERFMAYSIDSYLTNNPGKNLVQITGVGHLDGLNEKLKDKYNVEMIYCTPEEAKDDKYKIDYGWMSKLAGKLLKERNYGR